MNILIQNYCGNFAENKDIARDLRNNMIIPEYNNSTNVIIIDFNNIDSTTQSFIHALISELFQKNGEDVLKRIEFKNCNKAVKSLITAVINYSLE